MELYQLRTFVAVAEEEHLTRAAERLHASQPAVSAQIKALEEELGASLFLRGPRGMRLTETGRALMEQARKTLGAAEELLSQARGLRDEVFGEARLGLNNEPHRLRIPEFFTAMQRMFPRVEMQLLQSNSPNILGKIKSGELDAGFVYENILDAGGEVEAVALERVPMAVIGPTSWRERLQGADWRALSELPWVWFPYRCPFELLLSSELDRRGLTIQKVMISDSDATLKSLSAAGHGLTLIRMDDALDAEAAGEVCVWGGGAPELGLSFMYRRERRADRVIQALIKAACEVWDVRGRATSRREGREDTAP